MVLGNRSRGKAGAGLSLRQVSGLTQDLTLLGRGPRWRAVGSGNPAGPLCHVAHSLELCGVGICFWVFSGRSLGLKLLPDGAHVAQPRCQREGFWEVIRHVASPSDLSQTLLVGGGLLVPCSLPEPPVVKKLAQMITWVPGQGDRFQSMDFL